MHQRLVGTTLIVENIPYRYIKFIKQDIAPLFSNIQDCKDTMKGIESICYNLFISIVRLATQFNMHPGL